MKRDCSASAGFAERGRTNVSLRTAVLMAAGAVGIFYGGMYARATPGGEVRKGLSFAGTLTGVSGKQRLTFTFTNKTGVTCAVPSKDTHENGNFVAELPIDSCPASLFDGGDVTYTVKVGDDALPGEFNVNPVPYAKYAEQVGTPDCPAGYERDTSRADIVLCLMKNPMAGKGPLDSVVRVGEGRSAFWIDRFEASVFDRISTDGSQRQFGRSGDDYPDYFPDNGQSRSNSQLFAVSRAGLQPSASLTWFQANAACRASGKRLPTNSEWMTAAQGTPDPGLAGSGLAVCRTNEPGVREAGQGSSCASIWGAEDMVGNLSEYTDEWSISAGKLSDASNGTWPPAVYGDDATTNVASEVNMGTGGAKLPAVVRRGGTSRSGAAAGVFNLELNFAPTAAFPDFGFRCVIPR